MRLPRSLPRGFSRVRYGPPWNRKASGHAVLGSHVSVAPICVCVGRDGIALVGKQEYRRTLLAINAGGMS